MTTDGIVEPPSDGGPTLTDTAVAEGRIPGDEAVPPTPEPAPEITESQGPVPST